MIALRLLLTALLMASGMAVVSAPAHAQLFEPRYSPPSERRAPPQQRRVPRGEVPPPSQREYVRPRRQQQQYVPTQREARPERRGFFERLFGLPSRQQMPPAVEQRRRAGGGGAVGDADSAPAVVVPRVPKTIFVAVLGDSLAENLAPGLTEALSERPEVGLVREIRPGVGLLKEHEKSWRVIADEVMARDPAVAAAVVFIGPTGDPPAKRPAKEAPAKVEPEIEGAIPDIVPVPWTDQYAVRVDEIALAFRQKGIPLLWVGLPPVEDEALMAEHAALNDIIRQRVAALGGRFIDVWEGFVDEEEKFTAQGPNIQGRMVRLRNADGVHFTRAGARKLGHYVELELRGILAPKDQGDGVADLGVDPGAPTTPGSSRILILSQVPRTPGAVLAPPRATPPAAVLPTPPRAPEPDTGIIALDDGPEIQSVEAPPAPPAPEPLKSEEHLLVTGAPVQAKPGRGDDFSWPQTATN